jgi:thioredoxin-dependent peroxiredoxin
MPEKRTGQVTFKGNPLTLAGPELKVGDTLPDFTVYQDLGLAIKSEQLKEKIIFFNVVPSLDTGICDAQTRRFSQEAVSNTAVEWITVSTDTPMAQARWCGAAEVENLRMLSDYKDHEFGLAFGVYIEELGLLQRSIFIIGKDSKIEYIQRITEIASHPDYEEAMEALKKIIKK